MLFNSPDCVCNLLKTSDLYLNRRCSTSKSSYFLHKIILLSSTSFLILIIKIKNKTSKTQKEVMLVKKVILAVIMGLVVAGGIKEAGAAGCCCSSSMGDGITEGNHGSVSGGTASKAGDAIMGNRSAMAGLQGTMGPCDPLVPGNRETTSGHLGSNPDGESTEAQPPME